MSKEILVVGAGGPSRFEKKVATSAALALSGEYVIKIHNHEERSKPTDKHLWDSEGVKQFVLRGIK